jgi:hypothetical protein
MDIAAFATFPIVSAMGRPPSCNKPTPCTQIRGQVPARSDFRPFLGLTHSQKRPEVSRPIGNPTVTIPRSEVDKRLSVAPVQRPVAPGSGWMV